MLVGINWKAVHAVVELINTQREANAIEQFLNDLSDDLMSDVTAKLALQRVGKLELVPEFLLDLVQGSMR